MGVTAGWSTKSEVYILKMSGRSIRSRQGGQVQIADDINHSSMEIWTIYHVFHLDSNEDCFEISINLPL